MTGLDRVGLHFLDDGQMAVFRAMVLRGPDIERDGVSSWTAKDLCLLVERQFGARYQENGMLTLLTRAERD